ncbi:MAG: hypothetical protein IPK99_00070 [Flavobacteriales bacterium]|nr:hypothetical protein [Flavobacteriales bacterium]
MSRFHSLEVIDVKHETADAVSVGLRVPPELKKEFTFLAGQYLTLKLLVNGEELRRSYSICSSPFEEASIRIAVKRVALGRASNRLVGEIKEGDKLEVMPPMGHFHTLFDANTERHFVAFAAGSGITPILSILTSALRAEPKSRFTLFYGNTDTDDHFSGAAGRPGARARRPIDRSPCAEPGAQRRLAPQRKDHSGQGHAIAGALCERRAAQRILHLRPGTDDGERERGAGEATHR